MAMQLRRLSRRPPQLTLRLFHCRRMQVTRGSKRVVILGGPLERGKSLVGEQKRVLFAKLEVL